MNENSLHGVTRGLPGQVFGHPLMHAMWERVLPLAITYANAGMVAAIAAACSLALGDGGLLPFIARYRRLHHRCTAFIERFRKQSVTRAVA